ncbi:MAG TPA: hypothetical protein VGE74_23595 [Gemmata sp.]
MDLATLLAGTGPWGALIGVALTLAVNYYRTKQILPAAPSNPTPAPAPVPPPVPPAPPVPDPLAGIPGIQGRPLINLALQILPLLLAKKSAPVTPYAAAGPLDVLEEHAVAQIAAAVK